MDANLISLQDLLTERILNDVFAHALAAYPEECCGMIRRSGLRKCTNVQYHLHRLDPANHPRTARTAFTLSAEDALLLAQSEDTDDPVLVLYHSHPDQDASFSKADQATAFCNGAPTYPDLLHLIIACKVDHISEARLFVLANGTYQEVDIPKVVP